MSSLYKYNNNWCSIFLYRRSSPRSHDSHMLLTLDQAVSSGQIHDCQLIELYILIVFLLLFYSGNQELVCDITESVKSSQALQEVREP